MTTIVKRTTKGSPLTHAEVDANFDNLNQFKVEQDAAGNVGLGGVTPSAWLAGGGFVQVPGNGFLGNNAGYSSNAMLFGSNAYCDTVWRYKSSGLGATFFQAGNGAFSWHIAGSGTAGSVISFTQAMTLDSAGNLGIGTNAPTSILDVSKNVANDTRITVQNGNAAGFPGFRALGPAVDLRVEVDSGNALASIGTASNHAVRFRTNNAERMRIDASGNLGLGVTPVSIGGTNATVHVHGVTGSNPNLRLTNADTGATASDGSAIFVGNAGGAGASSLNIYNYESAPIAFYTATTERMRIDASGILSTGGGGLGYGTGSGGTVTQATSKSTAVTLNKPTGRITTHNAALAGGAAVSFQLSNTLIGASDVIVVTPTGAAGSALNYSARAMVEAAGSAYIILKNETAGSLSDAVVLNFAIIKGATA